MPSPDQSQYNPLIVHDVNAYGLVQKALTDRLTKYPELGALPVGSLEMVLLEMLALIIEELVYAVNRLPDGTMDILMKTFGVDRSLGNPPSTTVTFNVIDTQGYAIPAGLQVRLSDNGTDSIIFETTAPGTVSAGSTSTTVPATALTNTSAYNGATTGSTLDIVSTVSYLQSAVLATDVSGGEDPENDDEWRNRSVQKFQTLTQSLGLPHQFTAYALTLPGVYRADTRDLWNVTTSAAGHVTVAVADSAGAALSTQAKAEILASISALSQANLAVHVVDPNFNQVDVSVSAIAAEGFSTATVQANIESAITEYLSPTTWPWRASVYINELISLVDRVEGVERVVSVQIALAGGSLASTDVALTGPFPLVDVSDALNVSVS